MTRRFIQTLRLTGIPNLEFGLAHYRPAKACDTTSLKNQAEVRTLSDREGESGGVRQCAGSGGDRERVVYGLVSGGRTRIAASQSAQGSPCECHEEDGDGACALRKESAHSFAERQEQYAKQNGGGL